MIGKRGILFCMAGLLTGAADISHAQAQGISQAQVQEPLALPRLGGAIRLDGKLDDAAWQEIEPLPVVTHVPTFNHAPSNQTELRVAYDDHYLYLAAHCFDDAGSIVATSFKRDSFLPGSDYVGLILDTFGDNENAQAFMVKPTGARVDFVVFNDAQGPLPFSESWNTYWDAEVTRSDTVWSVELRIPFSSLRFQEEDGRVVMGLTAARFRARDLEWITFPPIPPQWGMWSFLKPSQMRKVVLEDARARKPVYISPYVLGGVARSVALDQERTAYAPRIERAYDSGLDFKYSPTSNLTLDLTLNTDFAQVEADNQQVNLTRFSLFFPEQRPFFQERASLFDFGTTEAASVLTFSPFSASRLFYSRRIGLHEGQPVRMLGGVRLVARVAAWDLALLNVQTGREADIQISQRGLPSQNLGALRLRRQMFNPYSYAGGMLTTRLGFEGDYNVAYGFDTLIRLFGDEYVALVWSQAFESDVASQDVFDRARVQLRWERRRYDGFGYDFNFSRSGRDYDPGLGFMLRQDYTRFGDQIFYGWLPGGKSRLHRHQISMNGAVVIRNADGSAESLELGPAWAGSLKSGANFRVMAALYYDDLRRPVSFPENAVVPVGAYYYYALQGRYQIPTGRPVHVSGTASAGTFFDGSRFSVGMEPSWVVSRYLELIVRYELNRIELPGVSGQIYTHVGRLRILGALNTAVSAAAFIQYNSALDGVVANVRLRYNVREGNDLYLVYNEGFNTDRHRFVPVLPLSGERTVLLKYSYTLPL